MPQKTELLYFAGECEAGFEAKILELRPLGPERDGSGSNVPVGAAWAAVLDRTAFYPGGGGQPPDRGTLAGFQVIEAAFDPAAPGVVLHYLANIQEGSSGVPGDREASLPLTAGQVVTARVDWEYRNDLMQQHTGQHIISAVAMRQWRMPTTGFHLGSATATVDLAVPAQLWGQNRAIEDLISQIERLVCAEVFADRAVRVEFVDPATAAVEHEAASEAGVGLRVRERGPAPKGADNWRVIAIDSLDRSPCGGTHVRTTGQVGLVTVQRWEKIRDSLRLEFACGYRALVAAARRRDDLRRLGAALSAAEDEAVDLALKNMIEAAQRDRELRSARLELLRYQAGEMASKAEQFPSGKLVVAERDDLGPEELKSLAGAICASEPTAVVLLTSASEVPRLVFARGEAQATVHAGNLLSGVMVVIGGRGGGSPKMAQGGGGNPALVADALVAVAQQVRAALATYS